jgi:phosphoadenosine phosphosulfate reductase
MKSIRETFLPGYAKFSLNLLKCAMPKDIEIFVGFSGGKDSVATAEIMRMSGLRYKLFYSFTGIDPPEVVRFIRKQYPECVFLKPKRTFWRNLSVNVVPSDRLRWCCRTQKKEPGNTMPHQWRVMGKRAEESSRRAKMGCVNYFEKLNRWEVYPLFYWNEAQLWEFIKKNNLPYCSLYDEGFERLGCVVCPYHSEKTGKMHQLYRDRWPRFFELFEKAVTKLYYKRVKQGKKMHYDTPEEYIKNWYLDDMARWYKK